MSDQLNKALLTLLNVCDGAFSVDGAGYNGVDASFARDLVKRKSLTPKQQLSAYKMLRKYRRQLASFGIDYDAIPQPKVEKEKPKSLMPIDDYLASIKFKDEPKIVRDGQNKVYSTDVPEYFWDYWKKYKQEIKEKGYSLSKYTGEWQLTFWEDIKQDQKTETPAKEHITYKTVKLKLSKDLLLKYQQNHVKALIASILNYNSALDASDTGTGKTYSALAVAKELGLYPIVVTPKSVISSFKKVMSDHFKIDGFVANYEQFRMGNTEYLTKEDYKDKKGKRHIKFTWNVPENHVIIFDEVHRCKSYKTQNAQMLVAAAEQNKKVIAMSATIGHNPIHMYALGRVLKLFNNTKGYFKWIFDHGVYKGAWGGLEFNGDSDKLKMINKLLYPRHGSRVSIKQLGNLFPDNKVIVDAYNMNGNAKEIDRVYSNMKKELHKFYKQKGKISDHHLAIMQKARQEVELLKVPVFVEMVNDAIESGHSVAVFVNYNQTVKALSKRLKTNCLVWGGNKPGERDQNIERFQNDESRVIICNIAAGGVGISLHDLNGKFSRVSIISPDWSAQNLLQALGRIHRAGSKSKAVQKIVFAADTIEENICEVVREKIENIGILNDGDLNAKFILLNETNNKE